MSIPRQNNKPYHDPEELVECTICRNKVARKDFVDHQDNCIVAEEMTEEDELESELASLLNPNQ